MPDPLSRAIRNQDNIIKYLRRDRHRTWAGRILLIVVLLAVLWGLHVIRDTQNYIKGCQTPHHACYEKGQQQIKQAESDIANDLQKKNADSLQKLQQSDSDSAAAIEKAMTQDFNNLLNAINHHQSSIPPVVIRPSTVVPGPTTTTTSSPPPPVTSLPPLPTHGGGGSSCSIRVLGKCLVP